MNNERLNQDDINYYNRGKYENPLFWKRLGGKPQLKDMTVLDVGCGHGSLAIDMALSGAFHVVGMDINSRLIQFAKKTCL